MKNVYLGRCSKGLGMVDWGLRVNGDTGTRSGCGTKHEDQHGNLEEDEDNDDDDDSVECNRSLRFFGVMGCHVGTEIRALPSPSFCLVVPVVGGVVEDNGLRERGILVVRLLNKLCENMVARAEELRFLLLLLVLFYSI